MSNPIAARKNGIFKAISTAPSFNKTPVGSATPPLPYPTVQDLGNSVAVVASVRFNRKPAYVLNQSTQPHCTGDNPGVAKGVKSGTVNGEVKPLKGSSTVRVKGQPIVRERDPCTMNGGNSPGIYSTTQLPSDNPAKHAANNSSPKAKTETPPEKSLLDKALDATKSAAQQYKESVSDSLHEFAGSAMEKGGTIAVAGGGTAAVGGAMVLTGVGAAPGALIAAGGGAVAAVGGGVSAVGGIVESAATGLDVAAEFAASGALPDMLGTATAYAERMVMSKIDKLTKFIPGMGKKQPPKPSKKTPEADKKTPAPDNPKPAGDGTTIVGRGSGGGGCIVGPYNQIKDKCSEGQQAHHIIPDTLNRTSNRAQGAKGIGRIPGMPSLGGGPAICLTGHAATDGTQHHEAHKGDVQIQLAAQRTDNGPINTLPVSEAIPLAKQAAINARPECKEQIDAEVRKAYPDHENDQRSMNGAGRPPGGDAKAHLDNGNSADGGNSRNRKSRKSK